MIVAPYPLAWPEGFPRKKNRETGQFKTGLTQAIKNVQDSLRRFGEDSRSPVKDAVVSSNVTLGVHRPDDPGVAVWFTWEGKSTCIPVDRYATVEANLQAIHHVLEARRVELRHGTLALVRASMAGLLALPAPDRWQDVLGIKGAYTLEDVKKAYNELAKQSHPDLPGGSHEAMAKLNRAMNAAEKELSE